MSCSVYGWVSRLELAQLIEAFTSAIYMSQYAADEQLTHLVAMWTGLLAVKHRSLGNAMLVGADEGDLSLTKT